MAGHGSMPLEKWAELSKTQRKSFHRKQVKRQKNAIAQELASASITTLATEHNKANCNVFKDLSTGTTVSVRKTASKFRQSGSLRSRSMVSAIIPDTGSSQHGLRPRQAQVTPPPLEQLAHKVRIVQAVCFGFISFLIVLSAQRGA